MARRTPSVPKRCDAKPLRPKPTRFHKSDKLEAIQSYKRAPTAKFQMDFDGSTFDLKLNCSSGSSGIDRFALPWVAQTQYNYRPGCPVVESETTVLINFSN
jgi:hypothetical protein